MDANRFWQIIKEAKSNASDGEEQAELIYEKLKALPPHEIIDFDRLYDEFRFRAYRRDLWGAAYIMNGDCSDDGFEYFRGWLISRGRAVYEKALANPDSLATEYDPDCDCYELESLLYVGHRAYEDSTGKIMPERQRTFPELVGEQLEEENLDEMFPQLTERESS
jgi:hypothetical protein